MTLKSRSRVTRDHWKRNHWTDHTRLTIIVELFGVEYYRDLEIRVRNHWRSLKMAPFESLGMVSYWTFIVTIAVSLAISHIFSIKEWPDLEIWVWGRSSSFKMARFDRPCMTFCWSAIVTIALCTIFEFFDVEIGVRGHSRSLKLVPFESLGAVSYSPSIVTMAVSVAVCELFSVKACELGNWVRGRSRSLKMAPFDRPWNLGYRSLKVIKIGAIRKHGYGLLFAFYSNYGRICSRLWYI